LPKELQIWQQFSTKYNLSCINLFPAYIAAAKGDDETFYKNYFIQGDVHWNEAGNKIMADELLKNIANNGKIFAKGGIK
jgi:hypothetical protein